MDTALVSIEMDVTDSRGGRIMNLESPERCQELCGGGGRVKDKKETRRYVCVV